MAAPGCLPIAWVLVGLRYFISNDSVGETLSSPGFYLSVLGTLALIAAVYWFMTDRSGGSRRDG
jgi:hypothetical protein